ncbi:MAG: hypothetical protein AAGD22_15695 [Verrucomicrobiota bacterium]
MALQGRGFFDSLVVPKKHAVMTTVPFRISDHLGGLAECSGMLALEKSLILVEFQPKDALVGVLKSKIKKVEIPFGTIESINFKKSFFGGKILLRLSDLELRSEIPKSDSGEIAFKIRKKFSLDANELVTVVQLGIVDERLQRMEEYFSD